jgi:hypothetical protein
MKTAADGWDAAEREALKALGLEFELVRRRHAADPPLDLLQAARAEVLPEPLQHDAARHLEQDPWTRTLADDLAGNDAALTKEDEDRLLRRIHTARAAETSTRGWRWLLPPAFVFATTTVLVAAAILTMWVVRQTAPVQPVQRADATVAATRQDKVFALPLDKPPITLSVAALTWRGPGDNSSLSDQLRPGLAAFRANDYATADQELARAAVAFPKAAEPLYYQGVARLFLNDITGASDSLSAAVRLADPSMLPDVTWYLAVAEERAGNMTAAREHVTAVCKSPSTRSAQACTALAKLQ